MKVQDIWVLFICPWKGKLYCPRNDPQRWNDPQMNPEKLPVFLFIDLEIIPGEFYEQRQNLGLWIAQW